MICSLSKEHMGLLKTLLQSKHLEASHLQNKEAERGRNKNIYAASADSAGFVCEEE